MQTRERGDDRARVTRAAAGISLAHFLVSWFPSFLHLSTPSSFPEGVYPSADLLPPGSYPQHRLRTKHKNPGQNRGKSGHLPRGPPPVHRAPRRPGGSKMASRQLVQGPRRIEETTPVSGLNYEARVSGLVILARFQTYFSSSR